MEVEKIFFLLFSTFLPFHPSLCLPIFLPSIISYFFLSYFLPRVSSSVFPLLANNYFFIPFFLLDMVLSFFVFSCLFLYFFPSLFLFYSPSSFYPVFISSIFQE